VCYKTSDKKLALNWTIIGKIPIKKIVNEFLIFNAIVLLIAILFYSIIYLLFYRFFNSIVSKLNNNNQKLLNNLNIAKDFQESLLPEKIKNFCILKFKSYYSPSDELSGDYFNYYKMFQ
jgi:hypothetical protein